MSDTLSLLVAVCAWRLYYCAEISFQVQRVSLSVRLCRYINCSLCERNSIKFENLSTSGLKFEHLGTVEIYIKA